MKWLHFIFSHSIFVSVCALALCYQSYELLQVKGDKIVYFVVFFSTVAAYNLYWLMSKYYFSRKGSLRNFFFTNLSNFLLLLVAISVSVICIIIRSELIPFICVASGLTVLYCLPYMPLFSKSLFRKAGFLKTLLLAFTWTYVTVALPLKINFFQIDFHQALFFAARFSFMLMLCIIFDSRDVIIDKMHNLTSIATDLNKKQLHIFMMMAFIMYAVAGIFLRLTFNSIAQLVSFIITGVAVLLVYKASLQKRGYIFYYFIVDGLMLFSSLATFVASI